MLGYSAINDLFFASLVRMIFQNTHLTVIATLNSVSIERSSGVIASENKDLTKEINDESERIVSSIDQSERIEQLINQSVGTGQLECTDQTEGSHVAMERSKDGDAPNETTLQTLTSMVADADSFENHSSIQGNSAHSSNHNELSNRTFEFLSTLDSLAHFRSVISAGLLSKQHMRASTVPAIIGCNDDYVMFQDYQNASVRVVEALECEMSKVKQTKEFLTKELSLLKCNLSQHQRDSEVRFELFEEEEKNRRETEEMMYKTCLNDLRDHLNELNEELQLNSKEYQQNIDALERELKQSILSLHTSQQHLQATKEKLELVEGKLQDSKNENAQLSSKILESQSKLLSTESNYQSQLSSLQKANALLQQSISRLEGEKKSNIEEVEEKIQTLQEEIVRLQAKLDKSAECNKATQTTIRSLNREKNELTNKVDELQVKCTAYEEEQRSLQQNIQDLRKRKDSTRAASSNRLESQLEEKRKAHMETQSRLEFTENSIKEQIKEAVNKERTAVKNERIEMQKLLKESQERIIELEDLLQQQPGSQSFSQGNSTKRARSSGQTSKQKPAYPSTSNQLESEEENLPNKVMPKTAHGQATKFGHNLNARFDDESTHSPVPSSKMPRINSNTRS